jgi:hypothetical protein
VNFGSGLDNGGGGGGGWRNRGGSPGGVPVHWRAGVVAHFWAYAYAPTRPCGGGSGGGSLGWVVGHSVVDNIEKLWCMCLIKIISHLDIISHLGAGTETCPYGMYHYVFLRIGLCCLIGGISFLYYLYAKPKTRRNNSLDENCI